uniref:Uncharacterized protein n=1 Tax=Parascaris univalens TaxID=6257 RepID=A0A914ZPW6_PARUN
MALNNPLWCLLLIFLFCRFPLPSLSSLLEESVSYCEHLVECESSSRMQERICTGNTILMPYWLPSSNQQKQMCYHLLRNDYILLERIERQLESQMLSCYIEQTLPLGEEQRTKCDSSLLSAVSELRNASGALIVDNCFQGTAARIERQCGGLRRCCTAHKTCSDIMRRSFLNDEKRKRLQIIWKKAKDCEMGLPVEQLVLADELASARRANARDTSDNTNKQKSASIDVEKNSPNRGSPYLKGSESATATSTTQTTKTLIDTEIYESGKRGPELGLSILFNGNTVNDSEENKAILSLVAASLASSKVGGINSAGSDEIDGNSSETAGMDDGSDRGLWGNATHRSKLSDNELGGGCVDMELVKNLLSKWYNKMIAELREEFENATIPVHVNITDILEQFEPKNNPLFVLNSTSFDGSDYPEDDAKIADRIADPLILSPKTSDHLENSFDQKPVPVVEIWKDSGGRNAPTKVGEHSSKENIEMKWENDEYRNQIKLYKERKNRNHLFATVKERNLTPCDLYLRCRRQVVRALDMCIVMSGRYEQQSPFALSTESLLEIGDHCNGEGYDAFNRLYELVILRNKRLRKCLNESDLIRDEKCARKLNSDNRQYVERLSSGNYTDPRECYSDVNSLQFACAQLRPCCPYFFRCREQTSDAESEGEILTLTSQLSANNHRCLQQSRLLNNFGIRTNNRILNDPIDERIRNSIY